ncbi:GTPase-activating protein GYP7 [Metschnikowia bicuspidata var. bicuspidata NRRL YB-4993]|uniref:GTPase-activating protein GYP7 n=1 Tax=Metschnikowia bicuspidata var. bicuspidata NRRL YB-4993 TaxID=869754 RepID=A0A1A0H8Y1_9ASCO|nr:GTPase-activating protein GYP7 [Metschnikowia bicuspidata var. bicuspidata NRRL YB-4993]OBA20579.1 GTPase-activating protein GYP7 [Metschnikowia bicuspidata var. bicuspidata NRRL YB-4993]
MSEQLDSLPSKMELLYVKSKTYIHPTTSKRDNIPGFLSLSKPEAPNVTNKDILLSFTPEHMLSKEELEVYRSVELNTDIFEGEGQLSDGVSSRNTSTKVSSTPHPVRKPLVSVDYPAGFCINLFQIYLIQFRTPSLGWWYGSIIIHSKSKDKFPIIFFHDDESPLTIRRQKLKNQSFDPFGEDGSIYWGGQDFLGTIQQIISVDRSTVEPSVYLIDPSSEDLTNFSPFGQNHNVGQQDTKSKDSPYKLPDINKMIATAKWKVLETVATFGLRTKNHVVDLIDDRVPEGVLKLILNKPEVQHISNDFDSARVYLAKWAAQVKEEAEQSQRKFMLEDAVYARINSELGDDSHLLTPLEISNALRRKRISLVEWNGFFDHEGRLILTTEEVKERIFHGGLENEARKEAWPFLLGVYAWDSSKQDREATKQSLQYSYCDFKRRWSEDDAKRNSDFWRDQKVRIEKDIHRNDRHLEIFKDHKKVSSTAPLSRSSQNSSPETPNEDTSWDLANIENVNLFRMREILLTFNEYNTKLGYVQGMTDLLSPIYVVFQDEVVTFWAFAGFMERMERNFVRDQSGMKKQMLVLNELVQFMLPNLFHHLEKCESTDLFFFFRMLLVWYKREFEWEDVNTLWEVFWTDMYSSQYQLFLALAVLSDNERIMKQNLQRFDEVLKYMNDLLGRMNLHDLLVRAELLFLRFRRMVDLIDRETGNPESFESTQVVKINPDLRQLLSRKTVVQKEVERPEGTGGG